MPQVIELIYRTLIAIVVMFILTKLLGKRQLSEMSLFGYISGISIGNLAAYIALEDNEVWMLGILALCIWVGVTLLLESWTLKSKKVRSVVDSTRSILIENGVVIKETLKKERMTVEELLEQLRDNDVFRIADVASAAIEANGDVSIYLKQSYQPLTASMIGFPVQEEKEPITVIVDGSYEFEVMKNNGIAQTYIDKQLEAHSLKSEDVFIAQLVIGSQLILHTLDERTIEIELQKDQSKKTEQQQADEIKQSLLQAIAYVEQLTKKQQGNK